MRKAVCMTLGLLLAAVGAFAQSAPKLSFEVASVKPAAPLDVQKLQAAMTSGGALPIGPHMGASRAEFTYMALRELITVAYKVKPYQISGGPDWLATQRFDIIAKYPDGATKADCPKMLQSLLEERFKLQVHHDNQEHPVLALVVGKNAGKLVDSGHMPQAIDESIPLKPGEISMDTADGPIRMTVDPKTGGGSMNMGDKGTVTYKLDMAAGNIHMDCTDMTMSGFAETISQFFSQMGGGRQVVDMTGLKGHYKVALDFSMADMMAMAKASGLAVPGDGGGAAASNTPGANAASDPSGGSGTMNDAVAAMGLKLEGRKAPVEQLIIDHIEKTPIEN